jgi:hypothetical protein
MESFICNPGVVGLRTPLISPLVKARQSSLTVHKSHENPRLPKSLDSSTIPPLADPSDSGGELDPHGADLQGNPLVGGVVYSNDTSNSTDGSLTQE